MRVPVFLFILLFVGGSSLIAQAPAAMRCAGYKPVKTESGLKRWTNKSRKDGQFLQSAYYAVEWLAATTKKKRKQKAAAAVGEVLPLGIEAALERITQLTNAAFIPYSEKSYENLLARHCLYERLAALDDRLAQLEEDKTRMIPDLSFPDYQEGAQWAKEELLAKIDSMAAHYLRYALSVPPSQKRAEQLRAVVAAQRTLFFAPENPRAQELINQRMSTAITTLMTGRLTDAEGRSTLEGGKLRSILTGRIKQIARPIPYLRVAEPMDQANVKLEVTLGRGRYTTKKQEPFKKDYSKEIGKDDKKRTVKATATSYAETDVYEVTGTIRLIDLNDGRELISSPIETTYSSFRSWATMTGSKEALPKSVIRKLNGPKKPFAEADMRQGNYLLLAGQIAEKIKTVMWEEANYTKLPVYRQ